MCVVRVCVRVCAYRYRETPVAGSYADCPLCPGGYVCNTSTVSPSPCDPSTFCPVGSLEAQPCPSSYYCPPQSPAPVPCPASHYCPPESASPLFCPPAHFCPPLSAVPLVCPLGYRTLPDTSNDSRASLDSACDPCGPGYYLDVRIHCVSSMTLTGFRPQFGDYLLVSVLFRPLPPASTILGVSSVQATFVWLCF